MKGKHLDLFSIAKLERSTLLYIVAFSSVGIALGVAGVLANLYVLSLGFDTAFLGTMTAAGQIIWALTALPAGEIGRRIGLRGSVAAGFALVALFYTAFINVPILPQEAWGAGLLVSYLLAYACVSLMLVNSVPYLMAITPEEQRGRAFSFQAAVTALTGFLGSLVAGFLPDVLLQFTGGTLGETGAYRVALTLPVLAYFISAGLLLKARPAPPLTISSEKTVRQPAPLNLLVFLGILFGVQFASEGSLFTFINVYFDQNLHVSTELIGSIFAVVRLVPFFIAPLLPLALKRWGAGSIMMVSYILLAASALGMAIVPHWIAAGAAFVLVSIATSSATTARSLFSQQAVQPRWRTTVNAVSNISMAYGNALAGYAGGHLVELAGFRALFLTGAMLALLAIGLYVASRKWKPFQPAIMAKDGQA